MVEKARPLFFILYSNYAKILPQCTCPKTLFSHESDSILFIFTKKMEDQFTIILSHWCSEKQNKKMRPHLDQRRITLLDNFLHAHFLAFFLATPTSTKVIDVTTYSPVTCTCIVTYSHHLCFL
jgi:hypothetical protein